MKKLRYLLPVGAAVALTMGTAFPVFAASTTEIANSASLGLSNFQDLGEAPADATMNVTLFLKIRNQGQLSQVINSHKSISSAQFHANFSPAGANYNAVENQLQHAGLTIIGTSDNNMAIDVQGTVSQIESVLGTTIHKFQKSNGDTFLANTTDYHVSGVLASQLSGATGVDQLVAPRPLLVSQSTGLGNDTLTPSKNGHTSQTASFFDGTKSANIQKAYDFTPVYQQGLDGSGQTIAIVDAYGSPTIQSDLAQYNQQVEQGAFGANDPLNLTVIAPPGMNVMAEKNPVKSSNAAGWAGEVSMDVELSHAAAPGANILLVATPNNGSDLYMGVNQVVDKHLANQISLSFGGPEAYTPASERQAIDQIFEQAAAEGINVFVSSGDWGDFTQDPFYLQSPEVSFPATDPNVVAVGGSALFVNADNSYSSEIPWGETYTKIVAPDGSNIPGFFSMGTGGGTSTVFAKPSWQTGVSGLGSTNMRQVPDVGYNSDPYTGFALVQGGELQDGWGGTSDAAPQWAAICALANQGYQKRTGESLPFINPILYANGQSAFHDVQAGTLTVHYTGSVSGNQYTMTMGDDTSLNAGPGWDDTTGLGTPDVAKVVNELVNSSN